MALCIVAVVVVDGADGGDFGVGDAAVADDVAVVKVAVAVASSTRLPLLPVMISGDGLSVVIVVEVVVAGSTVAV
jgi:hypothetical protein